jgi:hypothetical protein
LHYLVRVRHGLLYDLHNLAWLMNFWWRFMCS